MRCCELSQLRLKAPRFMKELHEIRSELSRLPEAERAKEQKRVWEKYRKRLGHLYVEG